MNIEKFFNLSNVFLKNGYRLYLVGGAVRDILLSKENNDFDVCTDATPKQMKNFFDEYDDSFEKYGSIKIIFENENIDITTLRQEEYILPRKPSKITFVKEIEKDYLRRDFTINAIYMDEKGHFYDFCNGIEDLNNKLIKMIGDPEVRLKEDPLRILRALRFKMQLGFKLDESLIFAIKNNIHLLKEVSIYQKNKEIKKMKNISIKEFEKFNKEFSLSEYI